MVEQINFYIFEPVGLVSNRFFLITVYYAYTNNHIIGEYYIFNDKDQGLKVNGKISFKKPHYKEFSEHKGFQNFLLEKVRIEYLKLISNDAEKLISLNINEIDLDLYNIYLYELNRKALIEIKQNTASDSLRGKMETITSLNLHPENDID